MNTEQERADFEGWLYLSQTKYDPSTMSEQELGLAKWAYQAGRAALQSQDHEDSARLEWIERNARRDPDMGGNHTWWPTSFNKTIRGPSLREAIDHARRIEGEANG